MSCVLLQLARVSQSNFFEYRILCSRLVFSSSRLLVKHVDERNQEGGHGVGGGGGGGGDGDVTKCTVWVQYLELYLDNFRDLLAPKANKPINIHEDGARGVFVSGARTIEVKT